MTKSTTGTRSPNTSYTYWLTRDTDPGTGELSRKVRVWLAKPDRIDVARGAVWMAPAFLEDLYAEWTIEETLWNAKVYPDDDRQCVRVEGDKVKEPLDPVYRPAAVS